jgi:hypothetical protein
MNWNRRLTFRRNLWLFLSILFFIAGGFVNVVPGENKGLGLIYWQLWWWFFWALGTSTPTLLPIVSVLGVMTVGLALFSLIFAFVLQYIVGLAWDSFSERRQT